MDTSQLLLVEFGFLGGTVCGYIAYLIVGRQFRSLRDSEGMASRKDQFISLASHYLLNPITIIQTAVATLQERGTTLGVEERSQLYDAVERGQQRLWIFVQQIILIGEIDSGTLKAQMAVASIEDMVGSAVTAVDSFARAKNVKIHLVDNLHEVKEARFDLRRMKQAVIALVDNAVKFSLDEGEVTVRMGFAGDIFSISVEDNGIGMPDEVMSHLTEKFYRGTDTYTFDYEGVGLGLHAAQAIVRMHEGTLNIESKPQRGTVATIEFPTL